MNADTLIQNFDLIADAPGGIRELRELILQLAVRGSLVPQDASDEPARALVKKMRVTRVKRVADGEIRESLHLPPIRGDELPYRTPIGWEWIRIGSAINMVNGKAFKPSEWSTSGTPIVRIQNLNSPDAPFNYCASEVPQKFHIRDGDFLISWSGTPGTSFGAFIWQGGHAILNQHIFRCELYGGFSDEYLRLAVNAQLGEMIARAHGGVGLRHITKGKLEHMLITLPPLAEQKRIVARVDELMKRCDELETRQKERNERHSILVSSSFHALATSTRPPDFILHPSSFNLLLDTPESVAELRKTILQLAVQGRLVKQDAKEEPVPVLLMAVDRERDRLRQTGTIRKDAPLRPIQQDKVPFPIPREWKFVRLGCLMSRIGSGSTPRGGRSTYVSVGVPFLRSQNVWNDGLRLDDVAYITPETHQQMEGTHVVPGDILLNITGASLGRCAVAPPELKEANVSQHVSILRPVLPAMTPFLHLSIMSPPIQRLVWTRQVGMAREGLSKKVLELFEVPVPPLAEQKRIVAKVNELMALCDALEAKLTQSRADADTLAAAVVHHLCSDGTRPKEATT
jgi:type I restriction enzyme S subunit